MRAPRGSVGVVVCAALAVAGCDRAPQPAPALVRLTPTEHNNAVRDLFGLGPDDWYDASMDFEADDFVVPFPFAFAAEIGVDGFDGAAEGQVPSALYVEQVQRAAEHFAPYVHRSPRLWVCPGRDCAEDSVVHLAQRAWRRPLTDAEGLRLREAFRAWRADYGEHDAITIATAALLQSAPFLYRLEGAPGEPYTVASSLALFLWDSLPDTAVLQAADRDELRTAEQVRAAAAWHLRDERARAMVARFHRQLLEMDGLQTTRVDFASHAPRYAPQLVGLDPYGAMEFWSGVLNGTRWALLEELDLFVTSTVFDRSGTLTELLTSPHGWIGVVNEGWVVPSDTTAMYGPGAPADGPVRRLEVFDGNFGYGIELRPVVHDPDQRAGLLTLGAVLAARAHSVDPASIRRGALVLDRLLCDAPPPPPNGVDLSAPADLPDGETNRDALEARTSAPACAACHDALNPLGFAFEGYDSLGGWRAVDRGEPVDASGVLAVPGEPDRPFDDAVGLAHALAASDRVHDCYATRWIRYALGDPAIALDDPRFDEVRTAFRAGGDVRELLLDIASSDPFRGGAP